MEQLSLLVVRERRVPYAVAHNIDAASICPVIKLLNMITLTVFSLQHFSGRLTVVIHLKLGSDK